MNEIGSEKREIVKSYYRQVDAGSFPTHLFAENFRFYIPKYGIGHGESELMQVARQVGASRKRSVHHVDALAFIEDGNRIAVEGTSEGTGANDVEWHGGKTPGGRFCSIFTFDSAGLINDFRVYMDPDITGQDKDRFVMSDRGTHEW